MVTSTNLKELAISSVQQELDSKKKKKNIAKWIFCPFYAIAAILLIAFFIWGGKALLIGAMIIGVATLITEKVISDKLDDMSVIDKKASETIRPTLRKICESALNQVFEHASNKEAQQVFLDKIDDKLTRYLPAWFKKSGKLELDWSFDLDGYENPVIIDQKESFLCSMEIKKNFKEGIFVTIIAFTQDKEAKIYTFQSIIWALTIEIEY